MENKIALVTGGTSGIGKEIVKELLEKGCDFNISRQENAYIKGMKIGF